MALIRVQPKTMEKNMAVSKNGTESKETRGLSQEFMDDLSKKEGILVPILEAVKNDNNLILEIRNNYIYIYYRGGVLLKIEQKSNKNNYEIEKDTILGYMKKTTKFNEVPKQEKLFNYLPKKYIISTKKDAKDWADNFFAIKSIMDNKLSKKNNLEREFQQLVVRENNILGKAKDTDYYIIDIEYKYKKMKPDLVAVRWDSANPQNNWRLSLIEMKYGYSSISGKSGLLKHILDADDFLSDLERTRIFKNEMLGIFKQKVDLGLMDFGNDIKKIAKIIETMDFNKYKVEYIFLLAGYKQKSQELKNAIIDIPKIKNVEIKFAAASFMGYALYSSSMLNLEQIKEKLKLTQ